MTEAMMAVDRLDRKRHNYFLLKAYKQRHNATYEGAAELRLHRYQSSSEIVPRCQREKLMTLHTTIKKQAFPQTANVCFRTTYMYLGKNERHLGCHVPLNGKLPPKLLVPSPGISGCITMQILQKHVTSSTQQIGTLFFVIILTCQLKIGQGSFCELCQFSSGGVPQGLAALQGGYD